MQHLTMYLDLLLKKWVEAHDQSGNVEDRYKPSKQIRFKASMLRSDLCDYTDLVMHILLLKELLLLQIQITIRMTKNQLLEIMHHLFLAFQKLVIHSLTMCLKTAMYNVQDSKNYSKTTGRFWNYYRGEPDSGANNNINFSIKDSKFFDYKTSLTGKLEGSNTEKEVEIVVPLRYLSNFWRTLDMPLFNCEIWSENCVLTSKATRDAVPAQGGNPAVAAIDNPTNATFIITDTKLCVFYCYFIN